MKQRSVIRGNAGEDGSAFGTHVRREKQIMRTLPAPKYPLRKMALIRKMVARRIS
jgi:hypothetical protein